MTSLTPGTTYYVRAYATNEAGTSYGGQVNFTADELATVTTGTVTAITQTSSTGNGNITDLGVPNPTAHGVVWNASGTPTTSDSNTDEGAISATGIFTSSMTGLSPATTYYVRAYATNEAGASYGSQTSFITSNQPTVAFSASTYSVAENAGPATITVSLSGTSSQTVTVQYVTSNNTALAGSDYTSASGTLTFSAGDSIKTFNITISNDSSQESNETINLALSSPVNATFGSPDTSVLTITNDDTSSSGGGGTYTPPSPSPTPVPPSPTPDTGDETSEPIILAEVETETEPVATDDEGNSIETTGNLITVTEDQATLMVNIPVALNEGTSLDSFTDAAGLTFEGNILVIPTTQSAPGGNSLIQITDDIGDLGTNLIIETGDAVGQGTEAVAEVRAIKSNAGFTTRDFSNENASLGEVASTVALDLNTLPQNASVKITTSLEPDPEAGSAFQLAADESGLGDIDIAYTINVEKTNLENGIDIESAAITMKAGADWVEEHGGVDSISIIRYDPQTGEQQILETQFLGYDDAGRAIFEGISPDGLSVFGLVGVKEIVEPPTEPEKIIEETPTPEEAVPAVVPDESDDGDSSYAWIIWLIVGMLVVAGCFWFFVIRKKRQRRSKEV